METFIEIFKELSPLFTAGIFFVAFLALIFGLIYSLNSSLINALRIELKADIHKLEAGQAELNKKLDQLLAQKRS